ncbi:hypothetical protein MHIR_DE00557 [Candidatus Doolittlea endobia]|uniref:Uncharacterized protein n=1 Tax=Candidatus Doolittlea endobia TaxID=1778262 RepID=A0A143WV74_9ENTR|nr:hypothetical protein MHIR_DE00557 [Candidatus Doolittlea endobia]
MCRNKILKLGRKFIGKSENVICYLITFTILGHIMSSHSFLRRLTMGRKLFITSSLIRTLIVFLILLVLWSTIAWSVILP